MNSAKDLSPPSWIARLALMGLAATSGIAHAADPYPQPQPYPQAQYPQQQYPQQQYPQQQGAEQHPMRALFASSLAQVAQATGSAAVVMVADGLTGALKGWFDNRRARKNNNGALGNTYAQNTAPAPNYPTQNYPAGMQSKSEPQGYPATSTDGSGYPNPGDPNGYPTNMPADANTGGYPTNSGYPATGGYPPDNGYPTSTPTPATPPAPSQLYAGIAYEIHLLQRDGTTMPVDPLNYTFRTGEQFRVYYRPSLPGRVDVFNINAAGQNAQIDSAVIAAGELASLGPYEFMQLQGDETLILRLTPCASPALYAATRNIVKVQDPQLTNASNNTIGFSDCSSTATRGLKSKPKTRDIRKVSVEGGTTFALDPIGANELGGGDMAPRQITITLMHR
jgi:hypothetical protein